MKNTFISDGPASDPTIREQKKTKPTKQKPKNPPRPYVSPDDDLQSVLTRGGPGIDQEMVLGDNVYKTDKMKIAPMREGENLIQVKRGKTENYFRATHQAVKELAKNFGGSEVGDYVPAINPRTGARLPNLPTDLLHLFVAFFCDNLICLGEGDCQTKVHVFFNSLGLTQGNPDPKKRISFAPVKKILGQLAWKIAAADVPCETLKFILMIYIFGLTWDKKLSSIETWAEQPSIKHHLERLDISVDTLVPTIGDISNGLFRIVEFDLTVDVPGTLHPEDFKSAVTSAGHKLLDSKTCGLSCIKYVPKELEGVSVRVYNKILETMQQGTARRDNIACKFARLLTPSTDGLKKKLREPAYNLHGLTRCEITFTFPKNAAWSLKAMALELRRSRALLENCLVSASIHQHIAGLEECLTGSIIVYFPETFPWKQQRAHANKCKGKSTDLMAWKNDFPEGVVVRWKNKYTGKLNGVEAYGKTDGRDRDLTGWDSVARIAAGCCYSGANPTLFVLVAGSERFVDLDGGSENFHFRQIPLERFAVAPKVQLETLSILKSGDCTQSWDQINVRPDELKMNPAIIPRGVISSELRAKEMLTELAIPESFNPEELNQIGDHCTDSVADFCGVRKGMLAPSEHNMPSEYSEWQSLEFGLVGRHKTPKLKFKFEGQSFWFSPKDEAWLRANFLGKEDQLVCKFRWNGCMGFKTFERSDISAPMDSESTSLMLPAEQPAVKPRACKGKRISAKNLRASTVGYEIMDAFLMPIKGKNDSCVVDTAEGLLTLPSSFSKWVIAEADSINNQPTDLSFLRGCKVVKPAGGELIGVKGNPNAEPRMWIITATEGDLVRQTETTSSVKARDAAAKKRARETEAEGAESSQADGGEPSDKIRKT
jgi:hypothetical protein